MLFGFLLFAFFYDNVIAIRCIYRTYHIMFRGGFLLSEIKHQLLKAPLAAAISPYLISLTHPTHA